MSYIHYLCLFIILLIICIMTSLPSAIFFLVLYIFPLLLVESCVIQNMTLRDMNVVYKQNTLLILLLIKVRVRVITHQNVQI